MSALLAVLLNCKEKVFNNGRKMTTQCPTRIQPMNSNHSPKQRKNLGQKTKKKQQKIKKKLEAIYWIKRNSSTTTAIQDRAELEATHTI